MPKHRNKPPTGRKQKPPTGVLLRSGSQEAKTTREQLPQVLSKQAAPRNMLWKAYKAAGAVVGALCTLVTLTGWYYALFPPVSFEIGDIDSADPYTTYFSVSNDGPFTIHGLKVGCSHLLSDYANGISMVGNPNLFITKESNYLGELPGRQTRSFQCPRVMGQSNGTFLIPIRHMDIALTAKYSGAIRAIHRRETRPFETETRRDGTMHWIPLSVPEANRLKSYDLFPWGNKEPEFVASEGVPSPPK